MDAFLRILLWGCGLIIGAIVGLILGLFGGVILGGELAERDFHNEFCGYDDVVELEDERIRHAICEHLRNR